jgi:hypothetical protein
MINGKKYSWEDITITFPHGVVVNISEIEYSDKSDVEGVYGKGSNPVGYGVGNYSAEGKAKMGRDEYDLFIDNLYYENGTAIYKHTPFPIVVAYANDDQGLMVDTLPGCKLTSQSNGPKSGDKSVDVEIGFIILEPILWNDIPANS